MTVGIGGAILYCKRRIVRMYVVMRLFSQAFDPAAKPALGSYFSSSLSKV